MNIKLQLKQSDITSGTSEGVQEKRLVTSEINYNNPKLF